MDYRREIDGLRALAVVAVILNHTSSSLLPSGFLGVDVFFVISGYVITASLHHRQATSLRDFLLSFYVRRIKRLLPALLACVLATALLISFFNPVPGQALKTGAASVFGLSNLYLIRQSSDYFADTTKLNPFTHTWSLGVEEQFYFLFPALLWLAGTGFWRLLGALGLASVAGFIYFSSAASNVAYYSMPTRFWELAAGAFAFWSMRRPMPLHPLLPSISLAGVFVAMMMPQQHQTASTIAAVVFSVLLIRTCRDGSVAFRLLSWKPVVFVGLISYSLYLWHWPVLVLARWTVGVNWWTVPILLGLMSLLAIASYRWVEAPMRNAIWSRSRAVEVLLGIGSATAACASVLVMATLPQGRLYAGNPPPLIQAGVHTLPTEYLTWGGRRCVLSSDAEVGKTIKLRECTLGKGDKRVLVIGNSMAAAFTQAFDGLVQDGYAVSITSSWGASQIRGLPNSSQWSKANQHYWETVIPGLTAQLQAGDWVFMISDLTEFAPDKHTRESLERLATLEAGVRNFSAELATRGVRLAVLHSHPLAREANCEPATASDQWFSPFGGPCKFLTKQETLQRRAKLDEVLVRLEGDGTIKLVDLMHVFCPGEVCNYRAADGSILYRDVYSHPSVEAARLSASAIREAFSGH